MDTARLSSVVGVAVLVLVACDSGGSAVCPLPIVSTVPEDNATDVPEDTAVTLTFSGILDPSTVWAGRYTIDGVAAVASSRCSFLFLVPPDDLAPDTSHKVETVTCGTPHTIHFTTGHTIVPPLTAAHISAGLGHNLVITTEGSLLAWGINRDGRLGDGTTEQRTTPTPIGSDTNWSVVSAGGSHSMALMADGTLWTWGGNVVGELGDGRSGSASNRSAPARIGSDADWIAISAGSAHSLALKADGTLWAWGDNSQGQLGEPGDGAANRILAPKQVGTGTWRAISAGVEYSLAIRADGTLWGWGLNDKGQLGDGTTLNRTTPTRAGSDTTWRAASAGAWSAAGLKEDGTLWRWGADSSADMHDSEPSSTPTPTQVGTDTHWSAVAEGTLNGLALEDGGTLWAWGRYLWEVHDGTQVGTNTTWSAISVGQYNYLALATDGTLWGWGENSLGLVGDGTLLNRKTPRHIGLRAPRVPAAVQGVEVTPGSSALTVTWSAVAGATAYGIDVVVDGEQQARIDCVTPPYVIEPLPPGVPCSVAVVAYNAYGEIRGSYVDTKTTSGGGGNGGDECPAAATCCTTSGGIQVYGVLCPPGHCAAGTTFELHDPSIDMDSCTCDACSQ